MTYRSPAQHRAAITSAREPAFEPDALDNARARKRRHDIICAAACGLMVFATTVGVVLAWASSEQPQAPPCSLDSDWITGECVR